VSQFLSAFLHLTITPLPWSSLFHIFTISTFPWSSWFHWSLRFTDPRDFLQIALADNSSALHIDYGGVSSEEDDDDATDGESENISPRGAMPGEVCREKDAPRTSTPNVRPCSGVLRSGSGMRATKVASHPRRGESIGRTSDRQASFCQTSLSTGGASDIIDIRRTLKRHRPSTPPSPELVLGSVEHLENSAKARSARMTCQGSFQVN